MHWPAPWAELSPTLMGAEQNMCGLWHVLVLFHVSLALRLARFMALLNLSFALNRIYSPRSLILERGRCMIRRGCRGESRGKPHSDFQEEMRDTGQELHHVWQWLSLHGQGGGKYWHLARAPHVSCSGPTSAGRPGDPGEADATD